MNSGQTKSPMRGLPSSRLRDLPKVELHRHLDCSMRFSTFLELAPQLGIPVPVDLQKAREEFLVLEPMRDLPAVLHKFLSMQKALASEEILERLIFECIEDAYNDGIRILELRWAPGFILDGHPQIKPEKIIEAFQRGQSLAQKRYPIAVGHLGIIQRIKPESECLHWASFFIEHKDFFVGVDLADDENFAPSKTFAKIFAPIHRAGMPVTIHAGESAQALSPQNVFDAVEVLGAKRIGHGLQIISRPDICDHLARLKIPLEICPWSNYLTQAIAKIEDHPIRQLMARGLRTTINTDDPGIFDISLTHEYELLEKHFAFTTNDFNLANNWAAEASFISQTEKQKVWPRPI